MRRNLGQNCKLRQLSLAVAAIAIICSGLLFSRSQAQQPQPTNLPPGVQPQAKVAALQAEPGVDIVCEKLFADYILKTGKINTSDINAAIELIASRGRENGFWRTVFDRFRESKVNEPSWSPSAKMLTILTKILETDGHARWLMSHPDRMKLSAWIPNVALPNEVLDTIIARAKEAERFQFDAYVVAVVSAHDKRSKEFLLEILSQAAAARKRAGTRDAEPPNPRFLASDSLSHAAIGLANLGERAGLAWLIETPMSDSPELRLRLGALADLTGLKFQTYEEWQAWWKTNPIGETFEPKSWARVRNP